MVERPLTPEYCEQIVGVLAPGWYTLDSLPIDHGTPYGPDRPARGPYRTAEEVVAALWRYVDRYPAVGGILALDAVHPVLIGPWRTRQLARAARQETAPAILKRKVTLDLEKQA